MGLWTPSGHQNGPQMTPKWSKNDATNAPRPKKCDMRFDIVFTTLRGHWSLQNKPQSVQKVHKKCFKKLSTKYVLKLQKLSPKRLHFEHQPLAGQPNLGLPTLLVNQTLGLHLHLCSTQRTNSRNECQTLQKIAPTCSPI